MGGAILPRARANAPAVALVICAALCAAYIATVPQTPDLAAHVFRADLWADHGWVLWNQAWYSGHTVPGYGLLYPPLGALFGPVAIGVAGALASTALFATIAIRSYGERAWLGIVWFGLASTVALWGSRASFALGVALGLAALALLQGRRPGLAAAAALAAGLASPVAGLFTGLAAAAVFCAGRIPLGPRAAADPELPWRGALAAAVGAGIGALVLSLAFPTDGYEPFTFGKLLTLAVAVVLTLWLVPRESRVVRWAAALYLLLALAEALVQTPLGDNVVRLGYTFAGPVLAVVLLRSRPRALLLLALPLLYWQWYATANDVADGLGNRSAERGYYAEMLDEVEARSGLAPLRVHVPPTRTRWEAVYVAERFPLARGWLRQLESDDFEAFGEQGDLQPAAYERWLREHGVSFVAASDAEPDHLAESELALLDSGGLPFLREVYSNDDWRLWEVSPEAQLAGGGARVTDLRVDGFSATAPGPGSYRLAVRYSPYFELSGSSGVCLSDGGGATTLMTVAPDGGGEAAVSAEASFSFDGLLRRERTCSS